MKKNDRGGGTRTKSSGCRSGREKVFAAKDGVRIGVRTSEKFAEKRRKTKIGKLKHDFRFAC